MHLYSHFIIQQIAPLHIPPTHHSAPKKTKLPSIKTVAKTEKKNNVRVRVTSSSTPKAHSKPIITSFIQIQNQHFSSGPASKCRNALFSFRETKYLLFIDQAGPWLTFVSHENRFESMNSTALENSSIRTK